MVVSPCYVLPIKGRTRKGAGQHPSGYSKTGYWGCSCAPFLFSARAQQSPNISNVMRRHREDIFYPTCTVSTAPDPRVDIFSVTLSGAIAESKGLELTEHAPVRFARALAISPSRPLDCARGDSLCCLVERRGVNPEVETPRPIGAFTFTSHTRSSQTAKDETKVQSFARRGCGLPAQSADSTGENPRLRSG